MIDDRDLIRFDTAAQFRTWLAEHQDSSPGVRLVMARKNAPFTTITREEALDAALEYGWIDGRAKNIDSKSFEQYYAPRGTKSLWSQRNVETVTAKIAAGEMKPRGLAEVERARADGRWDRAYAGSANAAPHPDFLAALDRSPAATTTHESLNAQNRFLIYFRLHQAKKPETLARMIDRFITRLEAGETSFSSG